MTVVTAWNAIAWGPIPLRPLPQPLHFREFLFDRSINRFIELSEILQPGKQEAAAARIVDELALIQSQLQLGDDFDLGEHLARREEPDTSYVATLEFDQLGFTPVFDAGGQIVAVENYALADILGSYAGQRCFYGLTISPSIFADLVAPPYVDLLAAEADWTPSGVPNCA